MKKHKLGLTATNTNMFKFVNNTIHLHSTQFKVLVDKAKIILSDLNSKKKYYFRLQYVNFQNI